MYLLIKPLEMNIFLADIKLLQYLMQSKYSHYF